MAGERAEIEERPKRHFEAKLRREFGPVCVEHYFEDAKASGMMRIGEMADHAALALLGSIANDPQEDLM